MPEEFSIKSNTPKKNMKRKHITSLAITTLCLASTANAALINGSFDDYDAHAGNVNITTLTPTTWVAVGTRVDVEDDIAQGRGGITGAQSGDYFIALDNNGATGSYWVYQTFTTVALQEYELSFWSAPANNSAQLNLGIDVFDGAVTAGTGDGGLLDETLLLAFTTDDNGWTNTTYNFTATSTSTTLRFIDQGLVSNSASSAGGDHLIDTVSVTAVPEPSSALLLLGGLGALFMQRRRA
ncbi:MAG: PEP-CTERM sorting domain-containing protein [Luteolibacter sp.]